MSQIFFVFLVLAMVAVAVAMGLGMVSMVKGGEFNRKYGNRLMQARVALQAAALAFFVLAIVTAEK